MQSTRDIVPDTRGTSDVLELERVTLPADVMHEICRQLAPYQAEERPITRQTVIYNDLSIDSLAVMDIVVELEDRFDIAIPINTVAEIRTVKELADAILALVRR
ncbi:MAG TPA: acyl carrier protein [Xanthobacteraceae bacterium]